MTMDSPIAFVASQKRLTLATRPLLELGVGVRMLARVLAGSLSQYSTFLLRSIGVAL
jgi:hypothetical protein